MNNPPAAFKNGKGWAIVSVAILLVFGAGLLMINSQSPIGPAEDVAYSFFIAGHTYGSPGKNNEGLHPPFEKKIPLIKRTPGMAFGVLTGDIVSESTQKDWGEVDRALESLDVPVYFAVGNHDITDYELYEGRYGKTYFSFSVHNDLFVVLDPNLDRWNISGHQLEFLKNTLKGASRFHHVFVFFHQVLWWAPDNKYGYIKINSTEGRAGQINFFSEVLPLFAALSNKVYMFAGDVGATDDQMPTQDIVGNIHFITSGMGRGKTDNFIIVTVSRKNRVKLNVIRLNKMNLFARSVLE